MVSLNVGRKIINALINITNICALSVDNLVKHFLDTTFPFQYHGPVFSVVNFPMKCNG